MRISGIILSLLVILAILPSIGNAIAAPSISIETSQNVYEYGDFLSIIVNVSEITGDNAIIHVIDPTERKVMLLNRPITTTTSTFPSQHPFDSAIWKPGTYMLELEYSNQISSTQFTVDDSTVWAEPWSGEYIWPATSDRIYEYACHEANYSLGGILRGARLLEEEAREEIR